jgi:hypothetical protein
MSTSAAHCADFDFQQGNWKVKHLRLKVRLSNCEDWEEFDGSCEQRSVLGGNGNIEDNILNIPSGSYRAIAVRSYDPATKSWAIWWLDGRAPHSLDVPVKGGFDAGVGSFYADDERDGLTIKLRFLWLRTDTNTPRWEQALSADGGATWETNWTMDFARA